MNLLRRSLAAEQSGKATTLGHLLLRASAELMSFYVHARHELEGGLLIFGGEGAPWKLLPAGADSG